MVKKKTKKRSKTTYQSEIARLKREKEKALLLKKKLQVRKKEIEELRELKREVASLKGVGTKRRAAGQITKKLGKEFGSTAWKGLKVAGKFAKERLEAEARSQDMERARARKKKK